jgi:hypoxanthine phosphoribosyltransferase
VSGPADASGERILFSQDAIAARVNAMARAIAAAPAKPEIAAPVLVGAFVFAADLLRALAALGLDLPTDFLWLRAYGAAKAPGDVAVLQSPSDAVRGKHVLLIDGVLDSGVTLSRAKSLLLEKGAAGIAVAVIVTKANAARGFDAEYSGFAAGEEFLYGYGMDNAGAARGLPDIRVRE